MKMKTYEVLFDVVGTGTLYIEAANAEDAYEIARNQNIDAHDHVEGIEFVEPTEDNAIDSKVYCVDDSVIIREEK